MIELILNQQSSQPFEVVISLMDNSATGLCRIICLVQMMVGLPSLYNFITYDSTRD